MDLLLNSLSDKAYRMACSTKSHSLILPALNRLKALTDWLQKMAFLPNDCIADLE